jgi:probable HAF family extracellular repeat protein
MKRSTLAISLAITLSSRLAIPGQLAAQDNQDHNHHKQVRYSIKVLGTLGGTFSEAVGINNSGSMAGISAITGNVAAHATLWQRGVITDLGTLGGPNSVAPEAEPQPNARGEVAGASDTATPDPNGEDFCGFGTHLICLAFIWGKRCADCVAHTGWQQRGSLADQQPRPSHRGGREFNARSRLYCLYARSRTCHLGKGQDSSSACGLRRPGRIRFREQSPGPSCGPFNELSLRTIRFPFSRCALDRRWRDGPR